jgi:beta-barrel assembly-enhancing protease
MRKTQPIVHFLYYALASIFLLAQCLSQSRDPLLPSPPRMAISPQKQLELGSKIADIICMQMPVLPDDRLETQYILKLGRRLAATISPQTSWPFEFRVIQQKDVNAFALPGGKVFINIGTIMAAENEAQLAGVMAHEIAHVYMQHSAQMVEKEKVKQDLTALAGASIGNQKGSLESIIRAGIKAAGGIFMLKYSRDDETQADEVGAIILYKAGYNPQAMADFLKTLEAKGSAVPQFLSDHPNLSKRETAIQKIIQGWPTKTFEVSGSDFADVRQHATGVKTYTAVEIAQGEKTGKWYEQKMSNGLIVISPGKVIDITMASTGTKTTGSKVNLKDVVPGSNMVASICGRLKILRPENWEVIAPQQQGKSWTIAPRTGIVGNEAGYGVMIDSSRLSMLGGLVPRTSIRATAIGIMLKGDSDFSLINGAEEFITVAGMRGGHAVTMQSTSPFVNAKGRLQKERDWLITFQLNGYEYYLLFMAPEAELKHFQSTFQKMLNSVQLLSRTEPRIP